MHIVPASANDAAAIATAHVRSWQAAYADILQPEYLQSLSIEERTDRWRDILEKQESQTLVARQPAGIAGFVSYGHCRDAGATEHQGEIWALYASPDVWGLGVGRALLDRAVEELNSIGRHTVSLWVFSQNQRGIRFYQTCGFRPVQGSENVFELGGSQVEEVRLVLTQLQPSGQSVSSHVSTI